MKLRKLGRALVAVGLVVVLIMGCGNLAQETSVKAETKTETTKTASKDDGKSDKKKTESAESKEKETVKKENKKEAVYDNKKEEKQQESKKVASSESENKTNSGSESSDAGNGSGSGSSGSSGSHTHNWVANYRTEHVDSVWVKTKDAWEEPVPKYEMVEKSICSVCGADITGNTTAHGKQHMLAGEGGGYYSRWDQVQTGTDYIPHPEEGYWTEAYDKQVPCGQICNGCGATK